MATASTPATDPLLEQMNSALRLAASPPSFSRRERRFSDTDRSRPQSDITITRPGAVSVLSRDGSRWLPAPDEQSLHFGLSQPNRATTEAVSSLPLEPHQCNAVVCSIHTVFATTELLELILSFLETKEILSLQRIARSWQTVIHDSPRLRLHFFTFGQWHRHAADFKLLPFNLPGLTMEKGEELCLGQWVSISLTPEAARYISPRARPQRRVRSRSIFEGLRGGLGPRAKAAAASDAWSSGADAVPSETAHVVPLDDLLVTQPPLVGMQAHVVYSNTAASSAETVDPEVYLPACAKLSCDSGITLGFLAETAQSLFAETEGSSNAYAVKVIFKAIMSFCAPEEAPRKRSATKTVTRLGS